MLEAAVRDSTHDLWIQEKVTESGRMNADIASLFIDIPARDSEVSLFGSICFRSGWCWHGVVCLDFLIGVVDEIFFVRHFCDFDACRKGGSRVLGSGESRG